MRAVGPGVAFRGKVGKKLCTPKSLLFRASESLSLSCTSNVFREPEDKGKETSTFLWPPHPGLSPNPDSDDPPWIPTIRF
jgi:hypothetical protein